MLSGQRRRSSADFGSRRYRSRAAICLIRPKASAAPMSPSATAMLKMSIVSRVMMFWNFAYRMASPSSEIHQAPANDAQFLIT